jgi:hypothetical protein
MSDMYRVSKDDVARLIRGRPSRGRVGSRQIRHRLRQDELERLEVARSRGFLLLTKSSRAALRNSWYLDCLARGCACLYVERGEHGFHVSGVVGTTKVEAVVADLDGVARVVNS